MFRELTRKKQKLTQEDCIEVLKNETRGVLSVNGDDGYPYALPINHYYNEEDGKIYFHSGKIGYKIDALKKDDKVSFCVFDQGVRSPGQWYYVVKSVIVFGRIAIIEDPDRIVDITTRLSHKFTDDEDYIQGEIKKDLRNTYLLELTPENMCGKLVKER